MIFVSAHDCVAENNAFEYPTAVSPSATFVVDRSKGLVRTYSLNTNNHRNISNTDKIVENGWKCNLFGMLILFSELLPTKSHRVSFTATIFRMDDLHDGMNDGMHDAIWLILTTYIIRAWQNLI